MKNNFEVDLVYTWVDGNDPKWQAKHESFTGTAGKKDDVNCKGRYADNDELKFSLRSVGKYTPWIRNIFIVTDGQVPSWLDTGNPKIKIIDHKDIIPSEGLPCFNSQVIEHCIYKIPGLAEHFIYANDDMFFNRDVGPDMFFAGDGLPVVRFFRSPGMRLFIWLKDKFLKKPLSRYNMALRNASRLVKKRYGTYYCEKPHHNADAYLKSDYEHTANIFGREIEPTLANHLRGENDVQRIIYSYVPIAEGRAHKVYVDKNTSFMLRIHKPAGYDKMSRYNPAFFCLNDSQCARDEDRLRVREYLEKRFPEKSWFEK